MSHFYGRVAGNRGSATRCGSKVSGYHTVAASWDGAIEVRLSYDPKTDTNYYTVYQTPWSGRAWTSARGIDQPIAEGIIGEDQGNPEYQKGYKDGYKDAMGSR